jgi:hypothetical protein
LTNEKEEVLAANSREPPVRLTDPKDDELASRRTPVATVVVYVTPLDPLNTKVPPPSDDVVFLKREKFPDRLPVMVKVLPEATAIPELPTVSAAEFCIVSLLLAMIPATLKVVAKETVPSVPENTTRLLALLVNVLVARSPVGTEKVPAPLYQ